MKMKPAVAALGALAQDTRLSIFRALVRAHSSNEGEGGLAAGEIGETLSVAPATLSFHLKELAHAGLVNSRREGRSIVYKADVAAMKALMDYLLKDCCRGTCGEAIDATPNRKEYA
ncbi:MAG: helix-turn-helix transcriptional regulator [Proteobacteria bacterium]|nr:helix-turn-helix transcriptional regulator [Pseudomonadota bacterium]